MSYQTIKPLFLGLVRSRLVGECNAVVTAFLQTDLFLVHQWKKGSSGPVTSIIFFWLVMALPRGSHSREIRSKNKLLYVNAVTGV